MNQALAWVTLIVVVGGCVNHGTEAQRDEARKRLELLEADPIAGFDLPELRLTGSASDIGKPQQSGSTSPITVARDYSFASAESFELAQRVERFLASGGWQPIARCDFAPDYDIFGSKDFGDWVGLVEIGVEADLSSPGHGTVSVRISAPFPGEGASDPPPASTAPSCLTAG